MIRRVPFVHLISWGVLPLFLIGVITPRHASLLAQEKKDGTAPVVDGAVAGNGTSKRDAGLRIQYNIEFVKRDSNSILADLYRPANEDLLPVVVMIHGGGWISGDKWNVVDHAREMASAGFVVMSINYRLAPKHPYPAQLEDCTESLRWLKENHQHWHADLERLGVWGYSAGAQLAAMLAFKPAEDLPKPRCCVVGGTPCDLSWIPEESRVLASVFGTSRKDNPQIYLDASPIQFVNKKSPACFLFHGTEDLLVPIAVSRSMHQKLRDEGVESEFFEIKNHGHLITFMHREARAKAVDFMKSKLKSE